MHTLVENKLGLNISVTLSQNGTPLRKVRASKKKLKGKLTKIYPTGILPVAFTDDHEILTVTRTYKHRISPKTGRDTTVATFTTPYWKKAKDFKNGDFVVVPCISPTSSLSTLSLKRFLHRSPVGTTQMPLNIQTAEIFGLYVAYGHGTPFVQLEFGTPKKSLAQRVSNSIKTNLGLSAYYVGVRSSGFGLRFGGSLVARAFRSWFGGISEDKKIPKFILFHDKLDVLRSFLLGYYQGNGTAGRTSRADMSTASPMLALQIQQALTRWGFLMSINRNQIRPSLIKGRGLVIANYPEYSIHSQSPKAIQILRNVTAKRKRVVEYFRQEGNYIYVRVRKVEKIQYDGYVYKFNVPSHDPYTISNFLVSSK
jgi:intein/homing endonuclease